MLKSPISVRVSNARGDQHITNRLDDVSYDSASPGGFDSATFTLANAIDVDDPLLALESRVYIYDTRTAETLWEGKLTDPGRSYSDNGQTWSLTARGPKLHASDRFMPYIPIDRTLDAWARTDNSTPGATAAVSSNPVDSANDKCLVFQFPAGSLVTTGSLVNMTYSQFTDNNLDLGGFGYSYVMGANLAAYEVQARVTGTAYKTTAFTTTAGAITPASADAAGSFPAGASQMGLRIYRVSGGATTVAADNIWGCVYDLWVRGLMYDKAGVKISGAGTYTNDYVTAELVVSDMLGRYLTQYDGANATVYNGTFHVDQWAYPEGVRPAQVLDDACGYTSTPTRWNVWESNAAGLYAFEWDSWVNGPMYEADVVDGFDSPGSSAELYNRVTVTGTDARGRKQSLRCTSTVAALTGIVREAEPIDLGAEAYSAANAQRVGDQFLAEHATPPNTGTLTVSRAIRNVKNGRMEDPQRVRPGGLIRVNGVDASPDALNATDRDGSTVFRLTGTSFKDADMSAALALDSPPESIDSLIANLARKRPRTKGALR